MKKFFQHNFFSHAAGTASEDPNRSPKHKYTFTLQRTSTQQHNNMDRLLRNGFGFAFDGSVAMTKKSTLLVPLILALLSFYRGHAYYIGITGTKHRHGARPGRNCPYRGEYGTPGVLPPASSNWRLPRAFSGPLCSSSSSSSPSSASDAETEIESLCEAGQYDEAIAILEQMLPDVRRKSCSVQLLRSLSDRYSRLQEERINERRNTATTTRLATNNEDDDNRTKQYLRWADTIVQSMLDVGEQSDSDSSMLPTAEEMHLAIEMWGSSPSVEGSSVLCQNYLNTLWSFYEKRKDERFVPLRESYDCAVSACSARDRGQDAAQRAESLLEEMESVCREHPSLTPDRSIANGVM